MEKAKCIWMDGKLVEWDEANVHILTHSLHYGLGVFEGVRCYQMHDGKSAIFRLPEHIRRLFDSAKVVMLKIPFTQDEIEKACLETIKANQLPECYIRPIVFISSGVMGVHPRNNPVKVAIAVWKWGKYLGDEAFTKGIRVKISSYTRYHPNTMMTRAKITGNYTLSVIAKVEAIGLGYDEALLLDPQGFVAEGSGENIFIVRDGKLKTTPFTSVLPGITRDAVITIAHDLGYEVAEQLFSRDELYIADEAFFTGTAAEIVPIVSVDDRTIDSGKPGQVTKRIGDIFFDTVKGKNKKYSNWLTYVSMDSKTQNSRKAHSVVGN